MSLFLGFAHVWTPLVLAKRVSRKPLPIQLAGERLVLFRNGQGRVVTLLDRCPHRGVALSLGRITREGCIECPFHGWQFDEKGACVHVPLDPAAKRDLLSATALPTREIGDHIWVYTAPLDANSPPPAEPQVPDALFEARFVRFHLAVEWQAHWTRAMENMLDSPHLPFVHRRTIGRGLRRRMTPQSNMIVSWQPTPYGGRADWSMDGSHSDGWLEFYKPNGMVLHLPIPGRTMRIHVYTVPIDATHTRMIVATARDFGRWNPLLRLFDQVNRLIIAEDRAVVESSSPSEVPPASAERSVASDRATLQFRRYYYEELRDSSATPLARLRLPEQANAAAT